MSSTLTISPVNAKTKTRNAILRMKKCSPKLKTVLRQRCQERIHNERSKILSSIREMKIKENFASVFGNILTEEWKNIEDDELIDSYSDSAPTLTPEELSLNDDLLLEELLEKELVSEHEDWLLQQYEEILNEEFDKSNEVVCPLCCLGFLKIKEFSKFRTIFCIKCSAYFSIENSLVDLQAVIYQHLEQHNKHCSYNPSFVNVPKNSNENNLCIICHRCAILNVIL